MVTKKPRFEVSTEGMKVLHMGREPWQLAKELVSNAWDEVSTTCEVSLESISPRKARLIVWDDGPGFAKINDAWTLWGHTPKRGKPDVRGRFNIGEKDILSVAEEATIVTSNHAIRFPKTGGRRITRATKQTKGTKVICVMPWGNRQVEDTIEKLKHLIVPDGITYKVNGEITNHRNPEMVIEAKLETVLQNSPLEPLKSTIRKTKLELYQANCTRRLYEMGIPVQSIKCPYDVNVMQKVPLPPNRDVVKDSYLQDIYRIVLDNTIEQLDRNDSAEAWVRTAIEDKEIAPETVKEVMTKRYGDKVVLWSSDIRANERAQEHGYEVVHGRTLSSAERDAMQDIGLSHSSDMFGLSVGHSEPFEPDSNMKRMAEYAKMLGKELLGRSINIHFFKLPRGEAAAVWDGTGIGFNVSVLGRKWFNEIDESKTALILHELAHHRGIGHNFEYQSNLKRLAGKAVHLAYNKHELFKEWL